MTRSEIPLRRIITVRGLCKFAIGAFILFVGFLILTPFPHYLPPDFSHGFLKNKASFFYSSGYAVGFYAHILTAPVGLLLGTVQLSRTLRTMRPALHQRLGTIYVWVVLVGVSPGGFVMATKAYGGWSTTVCFCAIAVWMWWCTVKAWRLAKRGAYREHGKWMIRSYVLMCSAIMLRLVSFGISKLDLDHTFSYQLSAWLSWVPAMIVLELYFFSLKHANGAL